MQEIILAIVEYLKSNQLYIKGQLVEYCISKQYNDTWHGVKFKYDTQYISEIAIYISLDFTFLETDITYKDNHEEESFIYNKIQFPTDLSGVESFCQKLINEYIPNILTNKDVLTLGNKPAKINF